MHTRCKTQPTQETQGWTPDVPWLPYAASCFIQKRDKNDEAPPTTLVEKKGGASSTRASTERIDSYLRVLLLRAHLSSRARFGCPHNTRGKDVPKSNPPHLGDRSSIPTLDDLALSRQLHFRSCMIRMICSSCFRVGTPCMFCMLYCSARLLGGICPKGRSRTNSLSQRQAMEPDDLSVGR